MTDTIREGDVYFSVKGGNFEVIKCIDKGLFSVKFINSGYMKILRRREILEGKAKDPYYPSIHGIGYLGEGDFKSRSKGKNTKEYSLWRGILERCYNTKSKPYLRYGGRGVTVAKEWHNFQVFAKWCNKQTHFGEDGFDLDKDLMNPDAKMYHPNNCSFIPRRVNTLLIACNTTRGDYPVGVYYRKAGGKYIAQSENGTGKRVFLGVYNTPEEAFQAYKTYKESLIKEVAQEEYTKGNINRKVYRTLLNWEILPYPE